MTRTVQCTASALRIRSLPVVGTSTDTGKRLIHEQTAIAYGESLDSKWAYIDAPAGRGWCSTQYLDVLVGPPVFTSPAWPKVPTGYAEIVRIFGSPGSAPCSSGRVTLPASLKLGWADQTVSRVACHKLLEDVLTSVFNEIHRRGYWELIETFDGIYNDRTVTKSQKISIHSWGLGPDLNASTNRLGAKPTMDSRIIAIFQDHGFVWGGQWSRPDGMHFQYAKGY